MLIENNIAKNKKNKIYMQKITIATWNINSIRIRLDLLKDLLKNNNIDIILLQETKCQDFDFPVSQISSFGYNCVFTGQKSYNGVAVLSKTPIDIELTDLPLYNYQNIDNEKRYIECITTIDKKIIRITSIYVPMGGSVLQPNQTLEESERFLYKINFYKRIQQRINDIKNQTNNFTDEFVVFGGDFNVAQEEIDLSHPKQNEGGVGFHIQERNCLRDIKKCGLDDVFRKTHPNKQQFTWWDYRTKAFDRNIGWRLDYLLCSQNVINSTINCFFDLKTRSQQKTSDHAPLILEFNI